MYISNYDSWKLHNGDDADTSLDTDEPTDVVIDDVFKDSGNYMEVVVAARFTVHDGDPVLVQDESGDPDLIIIERRRKDQAEGDNGSQEGKIHLQRYIKIFNNDYYMELAEKVLESARDQLNTLKEGAA
jgi:hypothetical protein